MPAKSSRRKRLRGRKREGEAEVNRKGFHRRSVHQGQNVHLVLVKRTATRHSVSFFSLSSHHCIQTAMDLEMQQAPDEIHPCG